MLPDRLKVINESPLLAVQLASVGGWEVLVPPEVAQGLLAWLELEDVEVSLRVKEGRTWSAIELTSGCDRAIERLIEALIDLRYETNQVQLSFFCEEGL